MYLLACDTSSSCGSLAIYNYQNSTAELLAESSWQKNKSHSELITTEFISCLKAARISLSDVTALAVGIGPGSFTGIRVGVNFIKTLSYSFNLPIVAMNSLEVLARSVKSFHGNILCSNYAFKNLCYSATFKKTKNNFEPIIVPRATTINELDKIITLPHLGLGTAFQFFSQQLSENLKKNLSLESATSHFPSAIDLGREVAVNFEKHKKINWKDLTPLYVRDSEAEEKLRSGALRPVAVFNLS